MLREDPSPITVAIIEVAKRWRKSPGAEALEELQKMANGRMWKHREDERQ